MFCNYPTEEGSLRFLKLAAGHIHHPPYSEQGFSPIKKEQHVSIPQFQQGFSKRKNPDKNVSFIIVTDSAYLGLLTCKNLLILVLWYKPLTAQTQSIFLLLKYFPKYLNSVSLTFAPEMFSRLCPLTTFHDDTFRQTPNDRDAPLYYSQTASKEFYLSSAKKRLSPLRMFSRMWRRTDDKYNRPRTFFKKNRRALCDFILLIGISPYQYIIPRQRWNNRLCFPTSLFISRETPFSLDWNCKICQGLHRIANTFAKCI